MPPTVLSARLGRPVRALFFGALFATLPLLDSAGFPDQPPKLLLIRYREWTSFAWHDTIRMSPPVGAVPGSRIVLPRIYRARPVIHEVAIVDSAGNVSAWSNYAIGMPQYAH